MATNFGMTGVETFILQLCTAQKRAGALPVLTLGFDQRHELIAQARTLEIPVHDFPHAEALEANLPRKLGTAVLRRRRIAALCQLLRDTDVLHLHSVGFAGFDALIAAGISGTRSVVVTHHTTISGSGPSHSAIGKATFWLEKHLATRAVMPYSSAAEELRAVGFPGRKVAVVPFCADESMFSGAAGVPTAGELRLIMSARLIQGKGHRDLLCAVARLRPRHAGLHLTLIGDGPERENIVSQISRLGLHDSVTLLGRVPYTEVPGHLMRAHVTVLPSHMPGETFPLSLIEGMTLGLPAIGSRWFGIPDIIDDGNTGFVVEPRDVDSLTRAIERFLVDPTLYPRLSAAAKQRALTHFSLSVVADQYARLYEAGLAAA